MRDDRPAKRKHLTADETLMVLAEIPPEHGDLVYLMATTGARVSEALNAEYGGIGHDADGRPVLRFSRSKTEAGLRPIPLTPETARMLTRRRAAAGATDDDLVFPNATGGAYDRRNWTRRYFKPAAVRAGVPWASPHKLRHGVATLMAERGYQAHDIANMLRQADAGALAQRTYMHPKVRARGLPRRRSARRRRSQPMKGSGNRALQARISSRRSGPEKRGPRQRGTEWGTARPERSCVPLTREAPQSRL